MVAVADLFSDLDVTGFIRQIDTRIADLVGDPVTALSPMLLKVVCGGKRLRATLVLACSQPMKTPSRQRVLRGATAAELLHVASLVHDDIIDGAAIRRGVPTISREYGDAAAILSGDTLLALAFEEAADAGSKVAATIAKCLARMCDGQQLEQMSLWSVGRSTDEAIRCIELKTAELFSSCCQIGGVLGDRPAAVVEILGRFGFHLGSSFQLLDDLEDLAESNAAESDLRQGVFTFPVLGALAGSDDERLARSLSTASSGDLSNIVALVVDNGGIEMTLKAIKESAARARITLGTAPSNLPAQGLLGMLKLIEDQADDAARRLSSRYARSPEILERTPL